MIKRPIIILAVLFCVLFLGVALTQKETLSKPVGIENPPPPPAPTVAKAEKLRTSSVTVYVNERIIKAWVGIDEPPNVSKDGEVQLKVGGKFVRILGRPTVIIEEEATVPLF